VSCWSTKAAVSLKGVKIDEKLGLVWRAYRKSQTLFRRYHPRPPKAYSSPRLGNCKLQSLLSREWIKLWTANLADTFIGSIPTKAH